MNKKKSGVQNPLIKKKKRPARKVIRKANSA